MSDLDSAGDTSGGMCADMAEGDAPRIPLAREEVFIDGDAGITL